MAEREQQILIKKGHILEESEYVVVIGGTNMDITGFSNNPLIGKDSNPGKIKLSPGGVGRNIAQNLVSLGIATRLISVVGDDVFGNLLIDDCNRNGIDTSLIRKIGNSTSSLYLSILDDTGDMQLALSDMEILEALTIDIIESCHSVIDHASAIVADTNLSPELLRHLGERYQGRIIIDTVSTTKTQKIKDYVGVFHTIKPNRKEAEILTGLAIKTEEDAKRAVEKLLALGVKKVVITMGKNGVIFGTANEIDACNIPATAAKNVTGAGDAFLATLVYGQLKQLDLLKTIQLCFIASQLTVQSESSFNPNLTENTLLKTYQQHYS